MIYRYMADKIDYLKTSQVSLWWHLVYTTGAIVATGASIYFGLKIDLSNISNTIDNHVRESSLIVSSYEKRALKLEAETENLDKEIAEIHTQIALILQRITQ